MKETIINEIINLMEKNSISIAEIADAYGNNKKEAYKYDLLCEVDGKKQRLSYDEGCVEKVIGIFPYKESSVYLETAETHNMTRQNADVAKIPPINFFNEMFNIRYTLNIALADLGFPVLNGDYFANMSFLSHMNWIVSFERCNNYMIVDSYPFCVKAKIRYFGVFE